MEQPDGIIIWNNSRLDSVNNSPDNDKFIKFIKKQGYMFLTVLIVILLFIEGNTLAVGLKNKKTLHIHRISDLSR